MSEVVNKVYYSAECQTALVIVEDNPNYVFPFYTPHNRAEQDMNCYGSILIDKEDDFAENGKTYRENIEEGFYTIWEDGSYAD